MNINFDYPFNERIRSYLRLEHLFERFFFFALNDHDHLNEMSIFFLLHIIEISDRTDFKNSILKDLEKYNLFLSNLREHSDVSQHKLESMLFNIKNIFSNLTAIHGKLGQVFRDDNLLNTMRNRLSSFGHIVQSDIQLFHFWRKKPRKDRLEDLKIWAKLIEPMYQGLRITLQLLRDSGNYKNARTTSGEYKNLLDGRFCQLMSIQIDSKYQVYPEIIVNKHVVWIQFFNQSGEKFTGKDLDFQIAYFDDYERSHLQ